MTTTPNPNNEPEKAKKELTPAQLQQRKKMVIFPLLFLIFAGSMWLIFAPSGGSDNEAKEGFNTDLPDPNQSGIYNDKRDAYTQEEMQQKQNDKMRSLQDFAFSLGETEETEDERIERERRQLAMAPKPAEYYENPSAFTGGYSSGTSAFQSSAVAYQDVNRQLGSFYTETAGPTHNASEDTLLKRIDELEARLERERAERQAEDEAIALMEKSYEMAARYMNAGMQTSAVEVEQPSPAAQYNNGKAVVQPVKAVRRDVVSLLSAPLSNDEFLEEFVKPRNWGFNTAAGDEDVQEKNSIRACIYQTVTITDGQQVQLRLQEPMMAGDLLIPENTVVTGLARLNGERLGITIEAVQYAGNVVPVELLVFDTDGLQGISVPGSEEISAIKEIAAGMGSGMGSSITITDDAGSQLLADLGRSAIQGTSQYIGKKMRTVKVTLKAGYKVLLLPPLK